MNEIVSRVREKISKKHPDIKPGDIRNKMRLIVFFNDFNNPKFNSQTKETLTNGSTEIREYLGDIDWDKFCSQILKNSSIMDPIVEIYKIKEEFKKRQDLKSLSNGNKRINVEKYLSPINSNKYLALCEGDCLHEDTEVVIISNDRIENKKMKEIKIGDSVFTDNHRARPITYKSTSIKKEIIIKLKNGNSLSCSEDHRLYVYNTILKLFEYKTVKNIDPKTDKLISSKLSAIKYIEKIVSIERLNDTKYDFLIKTNNGDIVSSSNHKFLVFIQEDLQFINLCTHSIKPGYYLVFCEGDSL